jgi:hypothetical protein
MLSMGEGTRRKAMEAAMPLRFPSPAKAISRKSLGGRGVRGEGLFGRQHRNNSKE